PPVRAPHLLGVEQRLHPARHAHRRTATAPAMPRVWVNDTPTRAPSSLARACAAPESRTLGGSSPPPSTSTSRQLHSRSASALATASLAQNRAARCIAGRGRV